MFSIGFDSYSVFGWRKFIIDLVSCNKAALKILEGTFYQDCTFELIFVPTYNESEETEVACMREKACELAGLETLKCEVKELTRDEAIIIMVESNLQRSTILPSEKAFAYKMRLEAMKRQAGRPTKDNYSPVGNNLEFATSSDELAEKVGESKNQIFRYIRLTELVPEILQMVDERQIAFRPAVEISYLSEEQQYTLLEAMEYNDATPSLAQAIKMKKFMQDGKLTDEVIQSIMQEEKPNQREKPAFRDERITKLIPKTVPKGQETDFVVKALEFYNRHLQRSKDRER